jgi:outer membrane receptor protein involved in Fe transport
MPLQLSIVCASILMPAFPLWAQSDDVIEEIQVTATRRAVRAADVSAALTVVPRMDVAAGRLITDSLAARPGVFLQQTTPGQGAVIVRGLKGSEVLHLVDGMRLNNAIFRNAPTQYMSLVSPGTIDRIEIVRGAPASLYGSDAVGGVVQAISRIPSFAAAGSRREVFLAYDSGDLVRILRASLDVGDEKLAGLVSGEFLSSGDRRTGGGERVGPSGYESKGARIALSATPDDDNSWLFDMQFATQPLTPRIDELVPGFGQTEPSSSEFYFAPNERLFAHIKHVRKAGFLDASWNFDLGWQRIVDDRLSRDFQSDIRTHEMNSSDLLGLSINVSGSSDSGSWIVGTEFYHDGVDSRRQLEDINSGEITEVTARFPDGSTVDQAALFGNILRDVGRRQALSGGLRFSSVSVELAESGVVPAATIDQADFSADLGWIFDVVKSTQLTANLGYGFRAPNVFDLGTLGARPGNRFNVPNPDLESERITQVDFGIRHRRDNWNLDVVLFALRYTDRIASVLTGDVTLDGRTITQSQNVDRADIHGIEMSAHWLYSESLAAEVVVNYLRGEQTEPQGFEVPADRIPPLNGRFAVRYARSPDVALEAFMLFGARQDRLSPRDATDIRIDPNGTAGWATANVSVSWRINDGVRLSTQLQNIFDRRYRVHGSGIDAVGRSLFVSLRAAW